MFNKCTFIGRLTKDVELNYTPSGKAVGNFGLAVQRNYTDSNNERQTDFLNFVVWGKPAESMANTLTKGDLIHVESRVQTRSYDGQDGKKVFVTEFVVEGFPAFLKVKKWENGGQQSGGGNSNTSQQTGSERDPFAVNGSYEVNDEDLPF